jgi:hypothetical protein
MCGCAAYIMKFRSVARFRHDSAHDASVRKNRKHEGCDKMDNIVMKCTATSSTTSAQHNQVTLLWHCDTNYSTIRLSKCNHTLHRSSRWPFINAIFWQPADTICTPRISLAQWPGTPGPSCNALSGDARRPHDFEGKIQVNNNNHTRQTTS